MELLTRKIIFEKTLLKVKIAFKDASKCDWWYSDFYGEIFEVKTFDGELWNDELRYSNEDLGVNSREELLIITEGLYEGYLIKKEDCKILSGT